MINQATYRFFLIVKLMLLSIVLLGQLQYHDSSNVNFVEDIDGNNYRTIQIDSQIWFAENLKTTRYKDGTPIMFPAEDNQQWSTNTAGAFAYYDNEPQIKDIFGALYNWYAVHNKRGLCPDGWKVPESRDWELLIANTGNRFEAGGHWKTTGTELWNGIYIEKHSESCSAPKRNCCAPAEVTPLNTGATNLSGFSAYPAGDRASFGSYNGINIYSVWWSATQNDEQEAIIYTIGYDRTDVIRMFMDKRFGFSVRCIKNME